MEKNNRSRGKNQFSFSLAPHPTFGGTSLVCLAAISAFSSIILGLRTNAFECFLILIYFPVEFRPLVILVGSIKILSTS